MPEEMEDYRVVVFGSGNVGKSSLVLRLVKGQFPEKYKPTIVDVYRQVISCNKEVCTLHITDTTGSYQFPAMRRLNISKGHAFMLVYSVTSEESIEELIPIYREILEVKAIEGATEIIPMILVGNKCDEESAREVSTEYAQDFADKRLKGCGFIETSAKANYNVREAFQGLLSQDKTREMRLDLDLKKSRSQVRKGKLKGRCLVM